MKPGEKLLHDGVVHCLAVGQKIALLPVTQQIENDLVPHPIAHMGVGFFKNLVDFLQLRADFKDILPLMHAVPVEDQVIRPQEAVGQLQPFGGKVGAIEAGNQIHLAEFDGVRPIKHLFTEGEGGLVHVHRAHDVEVVGDALFVLGNSVGGDPAVVLPLPGFEDGEKIAEIVFHSGQVHFIQAEEHRLIGSFIGKLEALTNRAADEAAIQIVMTEQVAAITPIRPHRHQPIFRADGLGKEPNQPGLARAGDARQNHKGLAFQAEKEIFNELVLVGKAPGRDVRFDLLDRFRG